MSSCTCQSSSSQMQRYWLLTMLIISTFDIIIWCYHYSQLMIMCNFNDLLPFGDDYRTIAMPMIVQCRFLDLAVPNSGLQLMLSAISFIHYHRKTLVIFCYSFLLVSFSIGVVFIAGTVICQLILIDPNIILPILRTIPFDENYCDLIAPRLGCDIFIGNITARKYVCTDVDDNDDDDNCEQLLMDDFDRNRNQYAPIFIAILFAHLIIITMAMLALIDDRRRKKQCAIKIEQIDSNCVTSNRYYQSSLIQQNTIPIQTIIDNRSKSSIKTTVADETDRLLLMYREQQIVYV